MNSIAKVVTFFKDKLSNDACSSKPGQLLVAKASKGLVEITEKQV